MWVEIRRSLHDQPFIHVFVESDLGVCAFLGVTWQEMIPFCVTRVKKIVTVDKDIVPSVTMKSCGHCSY